MSNKFTVCLIFILSFHLSFYAQIANSQNDELISTLQKDYFKLNALIQAGARYSFNADNFQGGRTFEAANARISLRGKLDGKYIYRIMVNAVSNPVLLDAWAGYQPSEKLTILFGAQKPVQTLDFLPDPGSTDFVDRTQMTGLLVASREIGISASGELGGFYYYAGIFNGSGLNLNTNRSQYGIGRLQYTFQDLIPGSIQLGLSGSHGNSKGYRSGSNGPFLRGNRTIAGADIRMETNKFLFATEYLTGTLETVDLPADIEKINGYYFTTGYAINEPMMVLGRWQSWSYEKENSLEKQVTLGINYNATELVSFQLNWDLYLPDAGNNQQGTSFIFQIQF